MNKFQARFIESVLKKVEMYGSGFKKVFSSCNANGIKFSYESNDDGFLFVFYRNDVTFFKFNESKHHVFIKGVMVIFTHGRDGLVIIPMPFSKAEIISLPIELS